MRPLNKVLVLLSTYNGEKYLREQLDSLYAQTNIDLKILVRDDGSTDTTLSILDSYSGKNGNIEIIRGQNIGVSRSFFELSHYAMFNLPEYDYYAFCDQDDVWMPDKLYSAVSKLEPHSENKLYFCRAKYVDKNLNYLSCAPVVKFFDYKTCIYRNPALGCTMVFDRYLLQIFCKAYPSSSKILNLHDAWIFKCAVYTGATVISDNDMHILYRQHGNNVTTAQKGLFAKYSNAVRRKLSRRNYYKYNTAAFLSVYEEIIEDHDKIDFLKVVSNYDLSVKNILDFLKNQSWTTESPTDKILWQFLVVLRLF